MTLLFMLDIYTKREWCSRLLFTSGGTQYSWLTSNKGPSVNDVTFGWGVVSFEMGLIIQNVTSRKAGVMAYS